MIVSARTARCILLAAALGPGTVPASAQSAAPLFATAPSASSGDDTPVMVTVGAARYTVTRDGVLHGPAGGRLRLPARFAEATVERVWGERYDRDLMLAYELTDGESTWTELTRLDPTTLALRWSLHLPGFNLGPALVRGDTAYLTVIGTVIQAELRTGRVLWQRDGLYARSPRFDAFALPAVRGDTVVIPTARTRRGAAADTVRLLARTGRVVGTYTAPRPRGAPARNASGGGRADR